MQQAAAPRSDLPKRLASGAVMAALALATAWFGGPVFDTYGRLVGVATTPHDFGAGLNVVLPVSWASQMRQRAKR